MSADDDLLRPSLDASRPLLPLYSATACWMTAFFGGPLAALIIFAENYRRAGLLRREAHWLLAGAGTALASLYYLVIAAQARGAGAGGDVRLQVRLAALAIAALLYWRLRPALRAQELFDIKPPNPWPIALLAIAAGIALAFAVATAVSL